MTFSGLPSVRDPKLGLKHSASSANSTSSSAASSPPKSPPSEQQQHASIDTLVPDSHTHSAIDKSFDNLVDTELKQSPTVTSLKAAKTSVPKKKGVPQNLSPAQSAAYRKRLNVNQVCDWCRYRKIRCDRESPCNSCQHSRRECIRTPPSVLLNNLKSNQASNNTDADSSSSSSTLGKAKRSRASSNDRRSRKSCRSSSTSSHHSPSYTSYSSSQDDDDDNDNDDDSETNTDSSVLPSPGTLALAGLVGFGADSIQWPDYDMRSFTPGSPAPGLEGSASSSGTQMDQEHLDRMRRIEILLDSVIPGAAEYITHGRERQQQSAEVSLGDGQRNIEKKSLSIITQGLEQQRLQGDIILSPQDRLARISLASPAIQTPENSWPSLPVRLLQEESKTTDPTTPQQHSSPAPDYIERMKRIELLLSSVQDIPLAMKLMNQVQGHSPRTISSDGSPSDANKTKKELKAKSKKTSQVNSNSQAVKRPHVAAGFAGQKPPPKLPQAIAEAALKKQNARKKRTTSRTAASGSGSQDLNMGAMAESAEATSLVVGSSSTVHQGSQEPAKMDPHKVTLSPTASFGIPSGVDNDSPLLFGQQSQSSTAIVMEQQQQQHPLHMLHRGSASFFQQQQQHQHGAQSLHDFQQYQYPYNNLSSVSTIGSMTIPSFSEPIASYGSLVVPASTSPSSSVASSPRTARAESVSIDGSVHGENMSRTSVDTMGSSMGHNQHMVFLPEQPSDQQLQQLSTYSQLVLGEGEPHLRFEFSEAVAVALQHQQQSQPVRDAYPFTQDHRHSLLQQQQSSQRPAHIGQDNFALGLNMTESLESLMKKNMTSSLDSFVGGLSGANPQSLLASPVSASVFSQSLYDTSSASPFGAFSQQQQQQQPQMAFQDVSLSSMWTPNQSDSFVIPTHESQLSWQQVTPRPQQSLQSINISANDSPIQEEMKLLPLDLNLQRQQDQQQQKQFSAHALFQQQRLQHPLQQHRASISIQHQHQQSFYIPQLQDDDDEDEAEDESESSQAMYNNNTNITDSIHKNNEHIGSGNDGESLSMASATSAEA